MNHEQFITLAARARGGDEHAMEQLLHLAYAPVYHQCKSILLDEQTARELTGRILKHIRTEAYCLENPRHFEDWLNHLVARRCIHLLPQLPKPPAPLRRTPSLDHALNDEEAARIVQRILEELPDDPRVCLVLFCCGGLSIRSIARLTNFSEEEVSAHLNQGQEVIRNRLEALDSLGVDFPTLPALPVLLRTAMSVCSDPAAEMAMVDQVLDRTEPRRRPLPLVPILSSVAALLVILLALMLWTIRKAANPAPFPPQRPRCPSRPRKNNI